MFTNCDHDWEYVKDWYGNSDIPNGTKDCSFYRCTKCGDETNEIPEGYQPPEGPDPEPLDFD